MYASYTLWQLWRSGHIWLSIVLLWLFLILLYRKPHSMIFQQVYSQQGLLLFSRKPRETLMSENYQPTSEEAFKVTVFARTLRVATGSLFTPEQSLALLKVYEQRNGYFDPYKRLCPECNGLAHYPTVVNHICPACQTCHGIGFLEPGEKDAHHEEQ